MSYATPKGTMKPNRSIVLFGRTTNRDSVTVADILREETVGGALMLGATVIAVIWANVDFGSYDHIRHLGIGLMSLQHWVADGLLTIFFFLAGLELKREFTVGSLSRPAEALVPIMAAFFGMITPAAIFLAINLPADRGAPNGWAIPMATDIAFALAILAVAGSHLPTSLRAFLLTLAIVDDMGAIAIIAVVFTEHIAVLWLLGGLICTALWWLLQWRQIRGWWLYLPLGVICWWCFLQSGVHATISGVLLGLLTRSSATDGDAPTERWEHIWRPISAGFAVPLFALLSAGVLINPGILADLFREPLALGIVIGLVLGKAIGVFGGAFLTARLTRAELASDLRWREIFAVAILAGVGFTVALLISDLAFAGAAEQADHAKAAVLVGSLISALVAVVALRLLGRAHHPSAPSALADREATTITDVSPDEDTLA